MEAPLLLDLALGDPTSIEDSIRVLRLAGRTSVRAVTVLQNAVRDWLRAIAAAVTIQSVVRSYQLRQKQGKGSNYTKKVPPRIVLLLKFKPFIDFTWSNVM